MRLACLHTAASNVAVFEDAAASLGLGMTLAHCVRPDLLEAAERAGGLTPALAGSCGALLRELARTADSVLLTCSSLGDVVSDLRDLPAPVLRTDRALAEAATAAGGLVRVLVAASSTIGPTRSLFEAAARPTGARIELRLVPEAWAAFHAGELTRYHALVAAAAIAAREGCDRIALAQASMAAAAALVPAPKPLTSPAAGLRAAARAMAARQRGVPDRADPCVSR